jgi:hypothetical protein
MSEPAFNVGFGHQLNSFHQCLFQFIARPGFRSTPCVLIFDQQFSIGE